MKGLTAAVLILLMALGGLSCSNLGGCLVGCENARDTCLDNCGSDDACQFECHKKYDSCHANCNETNEQQEDLL